MRFKLPFIISLLTMICGVLIAIFFGVNEDYFQKKIINDLQTNPKVMAMQDGAEKTEYIKNEQGKNWRYYQRFHFHSTGIGSMSLAALLLLCLSSAPLLLKELSAYMVSLGGFMYPFVWLFSAIYGPVMGRGTAKEAFALFGYMGGVFLVGLILILFIAVKYPLSFNGCKCKPKV